MAHQPIDRLFREALQVVNRSLDVNRGSGVYGRALEAADPFLEGHRTRVLVYEDDPAAPFAAFALEYRNGRFAVVQRGQKDVDSEWKVSRDYLKALVTHAEEYVAYPARLDLDWLASRVPSLTWPVAP